MMEDTAETWNARDNLLRRNLFELSPLLRYNSSSFCEINEFKFPILGEKKKNLN